MQHAPCSWDPIPCGCDLFIDPEESGFVESDLYAVESAQFVLWALSGRQYGCCELTFRPCRRDCRSGLEAGAWGARLMGGQWINLPCRSCSGACACTSVCEVQVPSAPICGVNSVIMDGIEVEDTLYRVEDSEWIVLDPAVGCLPDCQDMSIPLGEEGTWGFAYTYGTPPPTAGRRAVGSLACEIKKACAGASRCELPKRTQQVLVNGVPIPMIDPMEFFDKHRTGIYEVDLFLMAANPDGRSRPARVMSPDSVERPRMQTDWP
jgi:hypothetical protein